MLGEFNFIPKNILNKTMIFDTSKNRTGNNNEQNNWCY